MYDLPDKRWLRIAVTAVLAIAVALAAAGSAFRPFDRQLDRMAFNLLERPSSGQVHVVEMDAASMATIQRWPWPRDHYARLIAQLDAAGVRSISSDVDFSGRSDPAIDAALGAAIAGAKASVALPTFSQRAGFRQGRQLDSLPVAPLRDVAHLVSVSVAPDPDGYVRRMPLGTVTAGVARPSLAAFVAARAGIVGQSYPVDFSIDPASIPRHSFVAIERGTFDPAMLRGKDVIIGATAIELGDRYAVPVHGVIPGVILQALAAESLLEMVPTYGSWPAPLLLAALLALSIGSSSSRRGAAARLAVTASVIVIGSLAARSLGGIWFEIAPALALLAAVAGLRIAALIYQRVAAERLIDAETGLPNRHALEGQQIGNDQTYLIAVQIDEFDALKLAIGEPHIGELLRRLVERLQVAGGGATIYRIDPHTLVWTTTSDLSDYEPQLAGLTAMMRSPFEVAGRRIGVSLTFGLAPAQDPDAAANAAHAASLARRSGKPWRLYVAGEGESAAEMFSLLGELDQALVEGQIINVYQPKLNLATGQIDAAEALVRWSHPSRGMLPPDSFIPLIEESNRIDDLTIAVLSRALEDMRIWCEQGLVIGVAVNISATLLSSESFAARALALVTRSGVPVERLTFEVTESAEFDDTGKAVATLERFREAGIRISLDDYGTGQSSLNYLKLLPLGELKIDRMFVQHAHVDHGDAMLVRSTVQLAHELGLKVVAEGIEEEDCLAFLRRIGCDYAQGYFIGRPLAARDLAQRVNEAAAQPATHADRPVSRAARAG